MADGDDSDDDTSKTEDPSAKKLEEARKRGQVAQSRDMNTWLLLLATTILIGTAIPAMFRDFSDFLKIFLEQPSLLSAGPGDLSRILSEVFFETVRIVAIPFLFLLVVAFLGPFFQVGLEISPEVLNPDISKISIFKGFKRLFSLRSIVEFIKGTLKMTAIGVIGYVMVQPYFDGIEHTINQPFPVMMDDLLSLTLRMMTGILIALLAISLADLMYQKWEFTKQMRMTKQELKDEYKQTEGDPHIKGKLKQLRMEKARQRMMQAVPKADVVITNPTHFAVALKYDPKESEAPVVIAKGADNVAFRIREVAKEHDIIIYENPPLARSLFDTVEIDEPIPQELYKAVAEVISFVYQKKGKLPAKPVN